MKIRRFDICNGLSTDRENGNLYYVDEVHEKVREALDHKTKGDVVSNICEVFGIDIPYLKFPSNVDKRIYYSLKTAKDNVLDRYNEHEINITGEPTVKEKHISKLLLDDFNEAAYLIKLLANKFIKKEDCG